MSYAFPLAMHPNDSGGSGAIGVDSWYPSIRDLPVAVFRRGLVRVLGGFIRLIGMETEARI